MSHSFDVVEKFRPRTSVLVAFHQIVQLLQHRHNFSVVLQNLAKIKFAIKK